MVLRTFLHLQRLSKLLTVVSLYTALAIMACISVFAEQVRANAAIAWSIYTPSLKCEDVYNDASSKRTSVVINFHKDVWTLDQTGYFNVAQKGSAKLNEIFAEIYLGDLGFLFFGKDFDENSVPNFPLIIARGDFESNQHSVPIWSSLLTDPIDSIHASEIAGTKEYVHSKLYEEYAAQGAEVSSDIEQYKIEDAFNLNRATTFTLLGDEGFPLVHVQALVSQKPTQTLNVKTHFPAVDIPIFSRPTVEVGRLLFSPDLRQRGLAKQIIGGLKSRSIFQIYTYQKLFSWLNWDINAAQIVIQVNDQVRRILESKAIGLKFDKAEPVKGPTGISEWVLFMEKDSILKAEEDLLKDLLIARMEKALTLPLDSNQNINFVIPINERDAYRRIGFISTAPDTQSITGIYIPEKDYFNPHTKLIVNISPKELRSILEKLTKN